MFGEHIAGMVMLDLISGASASLSNSEGGTPITLDSIKILNGFRGILNNYAEKYVQINKNSETSMVELDRTLEDRRANIASENRALEAMIQKEVDTERKNRAILRETALKAEMARKKEKEEKQAKKAAEFLRYQRQGDDLAATINRLTNTKQVLFDFFTCKFNRADNKDAPSNLRDFSDLLDPLYGLPKHSFFCWYEDQKLNMSLDEIAMGNTIVRDIVPDIDSQFSNYTEIDWVKLILSDIKNANETISNSIFKKKSKKQLTSNVYVHFMDFCDYVDKTLVSVKEALESVDKVLNNWQFITDDDLLVKPKPTKDNPLSDEYELNPTAKDIKLSDDVQRKKEYIEKLKTEYDKALEEEKQKIKDSIAKQTANTTADLKAELENYFDTCLNDVWIGIPERGISIKEFMRLNPRFETYGRPESYKTPEEYCTFVCVGGIRYVYGSDPSVRVHSPLITTVKSFLEEYFNGVAGGCFSTSNNQLIIPYVIDFTFFRGICFDYPSANYESVSNTCRSLMFHMLTDTRASSVNYTMIDTKDPTGFFSIFNSFMSSDPKTGAVFNNKIYNTVESIDSTVENIRNSVESSSGAFQFTNIIDRNRGAMSRKIPSNVIFITDILNKDRLSSKTYTYLKRIISETRMGYSLVFMRNRESGTVLPDIAFGGTVLEYAGDYAFTVKNTPYAVGFVPLPNPEVVRTAGARVLACIKESEEDTIELTSIMKGRSAVEDAYDGIWVDFMINNNNNSESFTLNDTLLNCLVMGDPGMGKTRFLHSAVASIMNKYSPKSVRINFLDFKKGSLGTDVYTVRRLPHIGIISNVPNRVLGLNLLEYIDKQLDERANKMKTVLRATNNRVAIDKYSAYVPYMKKSGMNDALEEFPREIVILDEVQVLIGNDDEISRRCIKAINNIFCIGRAYGYHLILTTQWVHNVINALGVNNLNAGLQNKVLFYSGDGYEGLKINQEMMAGVHNIGQALYRHGDSECVVDIPLIEDNSEGEFLEKIENAYRNSDIPCTTKLIRNEINGGTQSHFARYTDEKVDLLKTPVILGESMLFEDEYALTPNVNTETYQFLMVSSDEAKDSVSTTLLICLLSRIMSDSNNKARVLFADFGNNSGYAQRIADILGEDNGVFIYKNAFTASSAIQSEFNQLHENADGSELYLLVNNISNANNNSDFINSIVAMQTHKLKVHLFLFAYRYSDITTFSTNTGFKMDYFTRAIFDGDQADYNGAIANYENYKHLAGEILMCYGSDNKYHQIFPFDYHENGDWLKNYLEKLLREYKSKKTKNQENNDGKEENL